MNVSRKLIFIAGFLIVGCQNSESPKPEPRQAKPASESGQQQDSVPARTSPVNNGSDTEVKPAAPEDVQDVQDQVFSPPNFVAFNDTYGCKGNLPVAVACENIMINDVAQGSIMRITREAARNLLVAPHGWFDAGTDLLVANIISLPGSEDQSLVNWGQVIAHSFRGNAPSGLSHNVNRPSLLDNDTCQDMPELATSKLVYEQFRTRLDQTVKNPGIYFEIHGQSEQGLENTIEIATERVAPSEAQMIAAILKEELNRQGFDQIQVVIEPVDEVFFNAGLTKLCGSISHVAPSLALHAENPGILRQDPETIMKTAKVYHELLKRIELEVYPGN